MNEKYFTYYFKVENSKVVKYELIKYPILIHNSVAKDFDYLYSRIPDPSGTCWAKKVDVFESSFSPVRVRFDPISDDQVPDYLKAYLLLIQQ